MKTNIEKILNHPSYWIEGINGILYNGIVEFMTRNDLNRTELGKHLGISKGRVSQILNDGEINFSIEKIIEISLKIGKYPIFELVDSKVYLAKLHSNKNFSIDTVLEHEKYSTEWFEIDNEVTNTTVLNLKSTNQLQIAY